jgi:predicted RNA-binding protein with PUA-like domain
MAKQYWLLKSEPDCYSFEDLKRDGSTEWTGIRNYQVRNYLRDTMQKGDLALFYHSSANPPAIVGVCEIAGDAIPDKTAWDKDDDHYDPKASPDNPIWYARKVKYVKPLKQPISISDARDMKGLEKMVLLQKGSRLSVMPVTEQEFKIITGA